MHSEDKIDKPRFPRSNTSVYFVNISHIHIINIYERKEVVTWLAPPPHPSYWPYNHHFHFSIDYRAGGGDGKESGNVGAWFFWLKILTIRHNSGRACIYNLQLWSNGVSYFRNNTSKFYFVDTIV